MATELPRAEVKQYEIMLAEDLRSSNRVIDADLKYFEDRTKGGRLPKRSDLNPMKFKESLPEIGLMEPIYDDNGILVDLRALLSGTKLDQNYGSFTGKLVSTHPHPDVFERMLEACRRCVVEKKPIVVIAETLSTRSNMLDVIILYIPMSEDGETIDRIFLHNQISFKYSENN